MIGRVARTKKEMAGTGVGVEVEREIMQKIGSGITIMTEIENTAGTGTVIGTGTGTAIENCSSVSDFWALFWSSHWLLR